MKEAIVVGYRVMECVGIHGEMIRSVRLFTAHPRRGVVGHATSSLCVKEDNIDCCFDDIPIGGKILIGNDSGDTVVYIKF